MQDTNTQPTPINRRAMLRMGLDHEKLTYHFSGRDYRLTDVYGQVAHDIIA